MTTDEWRTFLASCDQASDEPMTARGLRRLLREVEALVDRMEAVEEWALGNPQGDGLRAVLWPRKVK